jgi:PAS domain S-box-containing protein
MTAERISILMVDDHPARLLSYEVILASLGQNLIKASSATEAREILIKTDAAVVLMHGSMSDLGELEAAEAVRLQSRIQETAILFISDVHPVGLDKMQSCRSGVIDFISVPVIPELLRAKVSSFVELHRKTRMLEKLKTELERRLEAGTEELRDSETQFRTKADLLELATEAIIVRDFKGIVQFWNAGAETLYGWSREEAVGQDLHRMLRTVFPGSQVEVEDALAKKRNWQGNLIQYTRGGREVVVACRKTVNREANAILEVSRDITGQLRAEEALRESEKLAAMGRVAGIIAHEINNPLAAITNIFYLLRNHPSLNDEARSYAAAAEQELVRVSHITRQTLSFYREAKQPTPIRVHELLDDVAELQHRAFQANNIELRKKYSNASNVTGFPVELRQVFMNLIANAVQAMPQGGVLSLQVRESTDWMTMRRGSAVSIIDTGVGIKPEDAQRLFEPFYSTKAAKGTGLGLWISRGILQKYNGRISYRSYRRDGGCITCFRVFIPGNGTLNVVAGGAEGASGVESSAGERKVDAGWQTSDSPASAIPAAY